MIRYDTARYTGPGQRLRAAIDLALALDYPWIYAYHASLLKWRLPPPARYQQRRQTRDMYGDNLVLVLIPDDLSVWRGALRWRHLARPTQCMEVVGNDLTVHGGWYLKDHAHHYPLLIASHRNPRHWWPGAQS